MFYSPGSSRDSAVSPCWRTFGTSCCWSANHHHSDWQRINTTMDLERVPRNPSLWRMDKNTRRRGEQWNERVISTRQKWISIQSVNSRPADEKVISLLLLLSQGYLRSMKYREWNQQSAMREKKTKVSLQEEGNCVTTRFCAATLPIHGVHLEIPSVSMEYKYLDR